MGENSKISWTHHTFNPWWGCTFVEGSPACSPCAGGKGAVCYAKTWAERVGYSETGTKFPIWGAHAERRYFGDKHWNEPLKWNRDAEKRGVMERVFCMSMGDWAEGRPDQTPHLERLWDVVLNTRNLHWLMLTKRPQLINKLCPLRTKRIWQGVTAENQHWLDLRWEHLKRVDAEIYWLSVEPMFGRLKLPADFLALNRRAWVICGAQSGAGAVPVNIDDARYLRDQCLNAGVWFHMKQVGHPVCRNDAGFEGDSLESWPMDTRYVELDSGYQGAPVQVRLKSRAGSDPEEWPADLRVREYPEVTA